MSHEGKHLILIIFQYRSESTCMNTCVSSPELVWPGLYFSGLRPNRRQICWNRPLRERSCRHLHQSRPETDGAVGNAVEHLSLGGLCSTWHLGLLLLSFLSFFLSELVFLFAHSASIPQLPRVTSLLLFPPPLRLCFLPPSFISSGP